MNRLQSIFPDFKQDQPPVPLPPRLGMDDYASFVADSLSLKDPVKVALQKAIEEQIQMPFRLTNERPR